MLSAQSNHNALYLKGIQESVNYSAGCILSNECHFVARGIEYVGLFNSKCNYFGHIKFNCLWLSYSHHKQWHRLFWPPACSASDQKFH